MNTVQQTGRQGKQRRRVRIRRMEGTDTVVLTLTVDGKAKDYDLERLGSDFGDCFRLSERVGHPDAECNVYDVCLDDSGSRCECLGYLRWGKCKHVESLCALRLANLI